MKKEEEEIILILFDHIASLELELGRIKDEKEWETNRWIDQKREELKLKLNQSKDK